MKVAFSGFKQSTRSAFQLSAVACRLEVFTACTPDLGTKRSQKIPKSQQIPQKVPKGPKRSHKSPKRSKRPPNSRSPTGQTPPFSFPPSFGLWARGFQECAELCAEAEGHPREANLFQRAFSTQQTRLERAERGLSPRSPSDRCPFSPLCWLLLGTYACAQTVWHRSNDIADKMEHVRPHSCRDAALRIFVSQQFPGCSQVQGCKC